MRIAGAIEDPGAANGMVGLADALAMHGATLDIYATGAARDYAPGIGLAVRSMDDLALPFPSDDRPSAVIVGTSENPNSFVFSITAAAQFAGIPSFGFVDGPANAAHRFRGTTSDPLAHVPDYLLVSDPAARDAFVSLGVDAGNIDVVGHPAMDRVRARAGAFDKEGKASLRARLFPDIDPARPLVLFLAETSDGLDPAQFRRTPDYTLSGRGKTDGRTEICLEETLTALRDVQSDAALVLRLHPKNDAETFAAYTDELAAISAGGDPLEAVYASDLVVGMTSVLLFEAAVLRRPTLSVTPRESEAAWLSSIALGLTRHVCTPDMLAGSIREALNDGLQGTTNIDEIVPPGAAARMADAIARRITS